MGLDEGLAIGHDRVRALSMTISSLDGTVAWSPWSRIAEQADGNFDLENSKIFLQKTGDSEPSTTYAPDGIVYAMQFIPKQTFLAVFTVNARDLASIAVYDCESASWVVSYQLPGEEGRNWGDHTWEAEWDCGMAVSHNGLMFGVIDDDRRMAVWELATGHLLFTTNMPTLGLAFSLDSCILTVADASGFKGCTLHSVEVPSGEPAPGHALHMKKFNPVMMSVSVSLHECLAHIVHMLYTDFGFVIFDDRSMTIFNDFGDIVLKVAVFEEAVFIVTCAVVPQKFESHAKSDVVHSSDQASSSRR